MGILIEIFSVKYSGVQFFFKVSLTPFIKHAKLPNVASFDCNCTLNIFIIFRTS